MWEWVESVVDLVAMVVGWIFSESWIPPKDFSLLTWLFAPAQDYGIVLVAILLLEFFLPQTRRPWNRATLLSGTYLALAAKMGFYVVIVTPLIRNTWVYLGLPSLHLDQKLPLVLYMPFALLTVTFTAYWAHRLMHRVPLLWNIHKIHHSVENLNVTSVFHLHFLELMLHAPLHLSAVLLLGTDLVAPFGIIFLTVDYLAHSNVRVNMGRLTYVLCTPQAHRIHHSLDERHYDTNFGNTFMLWDHVFGTFYYKPDDLPTRFGVKDHVPTSFVKQQILPLVWMTRTASDQFRKVVGRFRSQQEPSRSV